MRHGRREQRAAGRQGLARSTVGRLEHDVDATAIPVHPGRSDGDGAARRADHTSTRRSRRGRECREPLRQIGHAGRAAPAGMPVAGGGHGVARESVAPHGDRAVRRGVPHEPLEAAPTDGEELRAVVAHRRADAARGHPPPHAPGLLEDDHPPTRPHELPGGAEPGDPGADDDHVGLRHGPRAGRAVDHVVPPPEGRSIRSGSVVQGSRGEASTSPAVHPAMSPAVSAIARTRGKTWAFSGGNCEG